MAHAASASQFPASVIGGERLVPRARMLQVAGFEIREVSGHRHTPGAFFGAESARLMVVAQKP